MVRGSKPKKAAADVVPLRAPRKCPVCGKPAIRAYYPFDSKRCADIDLGRWLTGSYVIPGTEATSAGEGESEDDDE